MRKFVKLAISIFVLILVIAAVPLLDGYIYKRQFTSIVTQINEVSNSSTKFAIQEYKLGWTKSTVKVRITSTNPAFAGTYPDGLTIENEISHGPFVYDTAKDTYAIASANLVSKVYLPASLQKLFFENQPTKPLAEVNTLASFSNVWTTLVKFSTLSIPNVGVLSVNDLTSTAHFTLVGTKLDKVDLVENLGAINFKVSDANPLFPSVSIQPIHYVQKANRDPIGIWNTTSDISVPSVLLTWADTKKATGKNISLYAMQGVGSNKLYSVLLKIMAKEITIPDFFLTSISDFNFSFGFNDLNPKGVMDARDMKGVDEKIASQVLKEMITPTTNLTLGLSLNSAFGAFSLDSTFSLKANANTQAMEVEQMLMNAQADVTMKIAAPLLNKMAIEYITRMDAIEKRMRIMQRSNQIIYNGAMLQGQQKADVIHEVVADLLTHSKITLDQSIAILTASTENLSVQAFSDKVTTISADNATELTQAYQTTLANKPKSLTPAAVVGEVVIPIEVRAQKMIDGYVKKGVFVQQGNDYTVQLHYADNMLKVNGKVMTPQEFMQMQTEPTEPAPVIQPPTETPVVTTPAPVVTPATPVVTAPVAPAPVAPVSAPVVTAPTPVVAPAVPAVTAPTPVVAPQAPVVTAPTPTTSSAPTTN